MELTIDVSFMIKVFIYTYKYKTGKEFVEMMNIINGKTKEKHIKQNILV